MVRSTRLEEQTTDTRAPMIALLRTSLAVVRRKTGRLRRAVPARAGRAMCSHVTLLVGLEIHTAPPRPGRGGAGRLTGGLHVRAGSLTRRAGRRVRRRRWRWCRTRRQGRHRERDDCRKSSRPKDRRCQQQQSSVEGHYHLRFDIASRGEMRLNPGCSLSLNMGFAWPGNLVRTH